MRNALIFWMTGLSGAGKTTLVEAAVKTLRRLKHRCLVIDGDDVRRRLHRHLGFSKKDILLNNALIAGLCQKERRAYDAIFVPIISPYRISRREARRLLSPGFFEVFVDCPIEEVIRRDVKGLYQKALSGQIAPLIGMTSKTPYERPWRPDLRLKTAVSARSLCIRRLTNFAATRLKRREAVA